MLESKPISEVNCYGSGRGRTPTALSIFLTQEVLPRKGDGNAYKVPSELLVTRSQKKGLIHSYFPLKKLKNFIPRVRFVDGDFYVWVERRTK